MLSSFSSMGKTWFNRFETSTHSHREEEIERGCEEKRECSPILIFPPPNFGIARFLIGWMGFNSDVSSMWVECGSLLYKLKKEFYIEFKVLLLTGFWVVEEAFIPYDTILVFWCFSLSCFCLGKSLVCFSMILDINWVCSNWLPLVRNFIPLGGSPKWGLAEEVGQWEPTMFKGKKKKFG